MKYLIPVAKKAYQKILKQKLSASVNSDWWAIGFSFSQLISNIFKFVIGSYQFSPLQQFHFNDECARMWNYSDRIIIRLFLNILKPTFKYIISKNCFHLTGPIGIKTALQYIQNALETEKFYYAIRMDIKSYYASIDHEILIDQIRKYFNDPRTLKYLEDIITSAIGDGGNVFIPEKGIPRRSSLSPFFGALYLSPLDAAFEKRKGIIYARYMDDIIILCKTKRQYQKSRKILFNILRKLKLVLSPRKTWMGALKKGFHFLGVNFLAAKPEFKTQMRVEIHPRFCTRALDKVNALGCDSVYPEIIQAYLLRWAIWWSNCVEPLTLEHLFKSWVNHARDRNDTLTWYGKGLLSFFQSHGNFIL